MNASSSLPERLGRAVSSRKTRAILLTLMGAGTIAYFMPSCDRNDGTNASTRTSSGSHSGGRSFFFWGGNSTAGSSSGSHSSSNVSRGGFGSSAAGSVHA